MRLENITDVLSGSNNEDSQIKTYLFVPTDGKDMKTEYPELGNIPEFNILSNAELAFVWLMGNRTSPLISNPNREEAREKALMMPGLKKKLQPGDLDNYKRGIFPSKISTGIMKMGMFNPSIRMRAKQLSEQMFKNLEALIQLSEEEKSKMTLSERKTYAELVKTVTNEMDDLIVTLENAYGIKENKRVAKESNGTTLMDKVLMRQ